jgi:hypothetical protein
MAAMRKLILLELHAGVFPVEATTQLNTEKEPRFHLKEDNCKHSGQHVWWRIYRRLSVRK